MANEKIDQRIAFTYRYKTGEEFDYRLRVQRVSNDKSNGYTLEGDCRDTPKPSTFWAARIVSDIVDISTGEASSVRDWLACVLGIDPVVFAVASTFDQYRYLQLIADFTGGFAQGWRFAVGKWFRDHLDIRCAELVNSHPDDSGRQKAVDSERRWTQGPFYSFAEGHIIYDDPRAYSLPWNEALQCLSAGIQVLRGTPNGEGDKDIHAGRVDFALSKPSATRDKLESIGLHSCTQNEFVHFLKTGILRGQTLEQMLRRDAETK